MSTDTHTIEPCRDADQLQSYIDANWRRGHVLARDRRMLDFTYATPWVDRRHFPAGMSVLCAYDRAGDMAGFLGAICAPYPRPCSYWLALWHVLPSLKGAGLGGRLLARMQQIALGDEPQNAGWIGTFGAGPEALPVYLKRGYAVRAARRWIYDPSTDQTSEAPVAAPPVVDELAPSADWLAYRFDRHPVFSYENIAGAVVRTEDNTWGRVSHVCRFVPAAADALRATYIDHRRAAEALGRPCVMDAWSFHRPAPGWALAPADLPSVFHPPEARGNLIYAVGLPFVPSAIHKGDCDQDRPNLADQLATRAA